MATGGLQRAVAQRAGGAELVQRIGAGQPPHPCLQIGGKGWRKEVQRQLVVVPVVQGILGRRVAQRLQAELEDVDQRPAGGPAYVVPGGAERTVADRLLGAVFRMH